MTGIRMMNSSALALVVFGEAEGEAIAGRLEEARLVAPVSNAGVTAPGTLTMVGGGVRRWRILQTR